MTCQELEARLDDFVDGALPESEARAVATHLAGCAACRETERQTRRLVAHAASLPRSVAPPRDLWPGVERQIARERGLSRLLSVRQPMLLAAAATVVLALLAALVWEGRPAVGVQAVAIPSPSARVEAVTAHAPGAADPELAAAERDYAVAATALLEVLQQRRDRIAPEDLARVEGNLEVIDRALAEVRAALARDPSSPELNRMLVATHRKKVDVLRRVVRLSTAL
jgi:predicted anti-sigma-YlaC factor YlaD